ncbi:MAG: type II toxin-antitoxin system VapC family toxin [Bifidobacteriaceae bacterium]|jgi:PIN domain nuclease of toxin-antitoxin system|nr:type II toxin-antitoxin system VapC family toxin [Bifidobacteriaceae bacterium]
MARLILDTNAFLWAVRQPAKLSAKARETIADRANQLLVPACVPWELAIKHRLGKLPAAAPVITDYAATLVRLGASSLSISHQHTLLAGQLQWDHADPFDRLLAAVAVTEGAPLVSADAVFAKAPGVTWLW